MTIPELSLTPDAIKVPLLGCGYSPDLLRTNFHFGEDQIVPVLAFARPLADSRSACVAVIEAPNEARAAVEACRIVGAPVVFACTEDGLQWWKQGPTAAEFRENIDRANIDQFFRAHRKQFSPDAVYRAKIWGRFQTEYQLEFVDLGLLPIVEQEVGRSIERLIVRSVSELKSSLGWEDVTSEQGHWLLQTVFWLISAKILHDKQVAAFEDLDFNDAEAVFRRLARHYGTESPGISSKKKLEALAEAAQLVNKFSSLVLTTTEALAYVYENTLISKETRSALGTHSTPSFLVDYIVGNLSGWIKEIPVNDRSVFEPACGHAAFLVSAMRLLTELLPTEKRLPGRRRQYLRNRLHGNDIDSFALELARLSLTLADIPNPDGWDLDLEDMFVGSNLVERAKRSTIFLANPPFDNFSPAEQQSYAQNGSKPHLLNKSAEMLRRVLPNLPLGAVIGVVVPQSVLYSEHSHTVRELLLRNYELKEVCLFPDKVFSFSGAESAVLVGRRTENRKSSTEVRYRRVRERGVELFKSDYAASTRTVKQHRFMAEQSLSLRLPDLEEIWDALSNNPRLSEIATVRQGFTYYGRGLPKGTQTYSESRFTGAHRGFVFFDSGICLNELPTSYWVNLDREAIIYPRGGVKEGSEQILLNYAAASRGPWRLKALIDAKGHPVTSNFIVVRPTPDYSLDFIWAVLNSPVANAFAFSHLGKRHNIVGTIRRIPVPEPASFEAVESAVEAYSEAIGQGADTSILQSRLLRIDSEVLRLYSLSETLEHSLLELFRGWRRVGVPFKQTEYLPKELERKLRLRDFLQFEQSWSATNRERNTLIDKNIAGTLRADERTRLDVLQTYADYHIQKIAPHSTVFLESLEELLHVTTKARRTT
jgi:N-6 DNA Methylase